MKTYISKQLENIGEMNKFLHTHDFSRKQTNRSLTIRTETTISKTSQQRRAQNPMRRLPNFPKPVKNLMPTFLPLSHETESEEVRVPSPLKSSTALRSMQQPERNHKPVSRMNTDAKQFSIVLREREFKNAKKTPFHDQIGSIPRG